MEDKVKLTQFAKGAGCGCKIAPAVLEEILSKNRTLFSGNTNLLVGNNSNDDAAVYDLNNGTALLVTADFFMPIVDDAFTFGQVAAANSLSDIYAMGGKPITAIALLGWPIDKLPASLASEVIAGARKICEEAGIVISGGHTIDAIEPFFGLSVNGIVAIENIKRNNAAEEGNVILLSKPLGVGILATAQKRGVLLPEHEEILVKNLIALNSFGELLGAQKSVMALTDITGFGLLGHLNEMCEGSNLSAIINYDKLPILKETKEYIDKNILPDATYRNWNAYSAKVKIEPNINPKESFMILPDPQTNGGLLISVERESVEMIIDIGKQEGVELVLIGEFVEKREVNVLIC